MNSPGRVSIVIRAYNEDEHIEQLLRGIEAQRVRAHEVILVDSGSTDKTVEIANRFQTKVIPIAKHEFTFGRALNIGCEAAEGDILVFVSAHVYPLHSTWLENLIAPFSNPATVLSYGKQRGDTLNKFSEHQVFAKWFPNTGSFPQRDYFCNNANCAIRRSAWEKSPYDEMLTGLEDLHWAKNAQEKGGLIAYVPEAPIIHVHDESWDQVENRYRREALAMRQIDEHVSFSFFDFLRLFTMNTIADIMLALRRGIIHKEAWSIVNFRYRQLLGTWRGHSGPPDISRDLRQRFYFPTNKSDHHNDCSETHEKFLIDYREQKY